MYSNKKVVFDVFFNILATALPIVMLQLLLYPKIAVAIGGQEFGLMLTIHSVWILLPNSLGNVLNNIKLLRFTEYQTIGEEGDIAFLLRQWLVISALIVFAVICLYCGQFNFVHAIVGTVIAILIFLKAYLEVGFRIKLNFAGILINNALMSIGFLVGYFFFRLSLVWEFIFLFGYLFSCLYCVFQTGLLKEVPQKTSIFYNVKKDACSLVLSVVIKNLTTYADKLMLYPLMDGVAVSIYYTATILGKITGMLTGPINSVFLSYIARWDKSKANIFSKVLLIGIGVCCIGYLLAILLAYPIIGTLFPQWRDEVMKIIPLTTATIMLNILASILNPLVLKFCKIQWQIGINTISAIVYFGSALLFWSVLGLKGFCIGTIIGALVKLIIMITVYNRSVSKDNSMQRR